jgi:formylglycine-generating enzyme required for sulfatase activity
MADVFISYKKEDRAWAAKLDAALRAAGYTAWWDTSLVAGDTWNETIRTELRTAKCVVVLWSKASWASRWVQAEAHAGFERDVLVAARLDAVTLEAPFNIVQTVDARTSDGMAAILAGVARKIGPGAGGEPAEPQPVAPTRIVTPAASVGGVKIPRMALEIGPGAGQPHPPGAAEGRAQDPGLGHAAQAKSLDDGARRGLPKWLVPAGVAGLALFALLAWWPWNRSAPEKEQATATVEAPAEPAADSATPAALALTPGQTFRDCADCPEMVAIPAGSFVMGSPSGEVGRQTDEGPQRTVSIKAFAAGKFEVTFDEWAACVAGGGCRSNANPEDEGWGRGRRPVINVSWNDAQEYVQWLSSKTGQNYRLLAEAEWEYATRGKTSGTANEPEFSWGPSITPEQAQYYWPISYNGGPDRTNSPKRTVTVGSFQANPFGLYDVHGNVSEWVQDCFVNTYSGSPVDGAAVAIGDCYSRVLRGGYFHSIPYDVRSASRNQWEPAHRITSNGFRLARTL